VEKISLAVNNYFSSLESTEASQEEPEAELASAEEIGEGPSEAGEQAGEILNETDESPGASELSSQEESVPEADVRAGDLPQDQGAGEAPSGSAQDRFQTGQTVEGIQEHAAKAVPPADEAEIHTHERHPAEPDIPPEKQ
jgi:hypothetical protein